MNDIVIAGRFQVAAPALGPVFCLPFPCCYTVPQSGSNWKTPYFFFFIIINCSIITAAVICITFEIHTRLSPGAARLKSLRGPILLFMWSFGLFMPAMNSSLELSNIFCVNISSVSKHFDEKRSLNDAEALL